MTSRFYGADEQTPAGLGFSIPDLQVAMKSLEEIGAEIVAAPQQTQWELRAVVKHLDSRSIELYTSEVAAGF